MPAPTADKTAFVPSLSFHPPAASDLMTGMPPAIGRRWAGIGSTLISLAILAAALYQLHGTPVADILALVPRSAVFWLVFVIAYLVTPASEWVIYHRLWSIPPSGMIALLRKRVANEIVLGYLGEVYFYAWVRRTGLITRTAPFGAIKDVAILSALTGNAVTLAMLAAALPFFGLLQLDLGGKAVLSSLGVLAVTSFVMLLLRKRLFSLPRHELWWITFIHLARIVTTIGLTALMWHLVLPTVGLVWWLILATLRQLLSRLPLMPNKDLAFVGLAIFIVGRDGDVAAMIAMIGGLILLAHLLVGSTLGAAGLIRREATA
ncbi:hypothetical protein DFR49_0288 [Hephaestia caeni]|uniref:Lysylphosphatidylglycerol synthase-like protein n=2 Tax=Hephaestia caeni TaxID=645617 RepID=A0A397PBI5_9SPHN|nr:hypothetical protein DFR49_0288 [Hephaestia caeni]